MKTSKTFIPVLCLLAGTFLLHDPVYAQVSEAEKLFEAGVYQQEAAGNFDEAIVLFNRVVNEYPKERTVAAKALLRLGICYERQGNQKASGAYQQIISKYSDQVSLVNEARNRLAAMSNQELAGLSMTRLLPAEVYLECQTLSPDETKLTGIDFNDGQNLAVYDLAAGKLELLTKYDWSNKSCYAYTPVWSPDSREIAYYGGCWGDDENTEINLSITTLDGKTHVLFKNNDKGGVAPCDWLPDKSAILAVNGNDKGIYKLVLISTKDGVSRDLCQLQRTFKGTDVSIAQASGIADVSPDGQLIVFSDSEGPDNGQRDIYTISAKDGTKKMLVQHPADDREPRWSPDGRHIVFLSNRHGSWALWGVAIQDGQTDGSPFMILEGMADKELAFWTKKGLCSRTMANISEIYTLNIDPVSKKVTGKPKIMETLSYGRSSMPQWSPDGKYMSYRALFESDPSSYVIIKPTKGGEPKKIKYELPIRPVGGSYRWLPDGSGIGFLYWDADKNIYFSRLDPETGEWHTKQVPTGDFQGNMMNLAWSGDGKAFFYTNIGTPGQESGIVKHELETGSESYVLRNEKGDSLSYEWWNLKMSPDCKTLAVKWGNSISLLDIGTGKLDQIIPDEKYVLLSPVWSHDGKNLLVKGPSKKGDETNELFIISLADRTCTSLNISQFLPKGARIYASHDWSTDGKTIVFDTRSWKSEANLIRNLIPEK